MAGGQKHPELLPPRGGPWEQSQLSGSLGAHSLGSWRRDFAQAPLAAAGGAAVGSGQWGWGSPLGLASPDARDSFLMLSTHHPDVSPY